MSKEKVVFPDSLAGRARINFDMYSGYVNITSAPDYYFYWFFGTQDKNENAPLIIWTNGKTMPLYFCGRAVIKCPFLFTF